MTESQLTKLLGRDEIEWDLDGIAAFITGQPVLVTGAGGSIGSELCRQIGRFGPKELLLLGRGEQSIWEIDRECHNRFPDLDTRPVIADIRDTNRMRSIFNEYQPGVVFHTAAHKHVDLIEPYPEEVVVNNIVGTRTVTRLADEFGTNRLVMISTDKAVRPACVYGAGKRVSEFQVEALARSSNTVYVTVRFGNVLGSRGSVVPTLQKQIAEGGPVMVHPEATRYFMTIPEAAQLVIQAGAMARGGDVFLLNMDNPVKIQDLAKRMIKLMGLTIADIDNPDGDIEIHYTGLRPAEKLYEELLIGRNVSITQHPRIMRATEEYIDYKQLNPLLEDLSSALHRMDRDRVREVLLHPTSGYTPTNNIVDLTWLQAQKLRIKNTSDKVVKLAPRSA